MAALFQPSSNSSIKDSKISSRYSKNVIDSIDPSRSTERRQYVSSGIPTFRRNLVLASIFLGLCILIFRIGYLQVAQGAYYRDVAEGNRIRIHYQPADRGIIMDIHQKPLVRNVPTFELIITPSSLPSKTNERVKALSEIAETTGRPIMEVQQTINDAIAKGLADQPLSLVEGIDYDTALQWQTAIDETSGAEIEVIAARSYMDPFAYSHVLGYLGKITDADQASIDDGTYILTDRTGKSGIEKMYEPALRGQKGKQRVEVNAAGKAIEVVAEEAAIAGEDVVLAIDDTLQRSLYSALERVSTERNSPGGTAVAVDPRTGFVKAMVSYPGYDINQVTNGLSSDQYKSLIEDPKQPLFNKAVQGEYPSGSTFKLIVAAAALQEGVVSGSTTVNSNGGVKIDKWYFPDWKSGGHGITDVKKALAESVNTYFYLAGGGSYNEAERKIEGGLGIEKINEYAKFFGLTSQSGIDLMSEAEGFLPTPAWKEEVKKEAWYIGDTYNTSIGQGDVLVTPLQVAMYTSVIANGGTLYKPQLVHHTQRRNGEVVTTYNPVVRNQGFIKPEYIQLVQQGMRDAVLAGSARSMQALPVASAGKTGTAQSGRADRTDSWYTTFLPYEAPELVVTVLVEEGGESTEAAVPVAKQALLEYLSGTESVDTP